jgi:hypothetical protein
LGQELSESVERGEWPSVPNLKKEIMKAKEYARSTFAFNLPNRFFIVFSDCFVFCNQIVPVNSRLRCNNSVKWVASPGLL